MSGPSLIETSQVRSSRIRVFTNKGRLTYYQPATVVPFSLFTMASALEAHTSLIFLMISTVKSAILGILLLYTFTISNQINGVEEDRLNKPNRPIVSGLVSLPGAYARYIIVSTATLIFSHTLKATPGSLFFMAFGALHNFTRLGSFGPTKDFLTTAVLTSGLYSAWQLGTGDANRGVEWISCLALNLLFSISIQDLRDVIGDAATDRYTTPLLLGPSIGKCSYITCIPYDAYIDGRSNIYCSMHAHNKSFDSKKAVSTQQSSSYFQRLRYSNHLVRCLLDHWFVLLARRPSSEKDLPTRKIVTSNFSGTESKRPYNNFPCRIARIIRSSSILALLHIIQLLRLDYIYKALE